MIMKNNKLILTICFILSLVYSGYSQTTNASSQKKAAVKAAPVVYTQETSDDNNAMIEINTLSVTDVKSGKTTVNTPQVQSKKEEKNRPVQKDVIELKNSIIQDASGNKIK